SLCSSAARGGSKRGDLSNRQKRVARRHRQRAREGVSKSLLPTLGGWARTHGISTGEDHAENQIVEIFHHSPFIPAHRTGRSRGRRRRTVGRSAPDGGFRRQRADS